MEVAVKGFEGFLRCGYMLGSLSQIKPQESCVVVVHKLSLAAIVGEVEVVNISGVKSVGLLSCSFCRGRDVARNEG